MKNFYWKALSLTCICAVFMVIGATDTSAYPTYESGCEICHPGFLIGFEGPLHSAHNPVLTPECTSCHLITGDDPSLGYTPTSPVGTGCVGCHGRLEDEGNDSLQDGIGAGLRQHHFNAGIPTCLDCHTDSFPGGIYTPVGENVDPIFYPFLNPLALDPCDDGLDNDGDLLYDGDDPDCIQIIDTDSDGVPDSEDNCPDICNIFQLDADGDEIGDACDEIPGCGGCGGDPCEQECIFVDTDNDTIRDSADNCPTIPNTGQEDVDNDSVGDVCDDCTDTDNDGYGDPSYPNNTCQEDNCPDKCNTQQLDADNDGLGDACDEIPGCGGGCSCGVCEPDCEAECEQIEAASNIDNSTAEYAQLLFGDLNGISEISVIAVDEGSSINTSKASIDGTTDTVYTRYAFEKGTPGGDFGNSANAITFVKTRTPEAIKYITGIDYTLNDDSPGMCKEVNEYIYKRTRLLLTAEQRIKYDSEGKQLLFIDDYIAYLGDLPDPYSLITDNDTHLEVASVSVETYFYPSVQDDPDINDNIKDQYGVKYCKLIAAQNMLIWMLDMAFDNSTTLMKPDPPPPGLSCEDMNKSVGSCSFYFRDTNYFCEDYIGTNFTGGDTGNAKEKCLNVREGIYVDGVKCADREDINDTISGICAIQETDDGAYTWTMYEPSDATLCPLRFFTCEY